MTDSNAEPFPHVKPSTSIVSVTPHYDPSIHYPPDLFEKLWRGGFQDSGSLSDRISAWKELAGLPVLKAIPKQSFTTLHYKGQSPTEEMRCPIDDCGKDLTKMTASSICMHIHACTRRKNQKEAVRKIDELYPQTPRCPFPCNADLSESSRAAYARHLKQHVANRANGTNDDGWRCGVLMDDVECEVRVMAKNDHRFHLQEAHGISASAGFVEFCYWCHEWYQSEEDWQDHCQAHIATCYIPHELPTPSPPTGPYPGYNTEVSTGLVTKPGVCPFCLWDTTLPAEERINQYHAGNLETHIRIRHYPTPAGAQVVEHRCPSHACPQSLPSHTPLTFLDLLNHLIAEHKIPLNGKRGKSHEGELPLFDKLPALPKAKKSVPKSAPVASTSKRTKAQASPGYQTRENTAKRTNNRPSASLKENLV